MATAKKTIRNKSGGKKALDTSILEESAVREFLPYLMKGFLHVYGEENMKHIKEKMKKIIIFPYNGRSEDPRGDFDRQLEIFYKKLEQIQKEPLSQKDKDEIREIFEHGIIKDQLLSYMTSFQVDDKDMYAVVCLNMINDDFYARLIHEFVHAIEVNIKNGNVANGFEIPSIMQTKNAGGVLLNEYFTEKITQDIFDYLLQSGCPMLKNGGRESNREGSKCSSYWLPDVFMDDFYQKYKKDISVNKLNNSYHIFIEKLGKKNINKIMKACDYIDEHFRIGMTNEECEKMYVLRDECKKIIQNAIMQDESLHS